MTVVTWQDGFEGGESLATVYGAGNLDFGTTILAGSGRNGGHALSGGVSNVATGIAASHDPVIVGLAINVALGGNAHIILGDGAGSLASLLFDNFGRVAVNLPAVGGSPTLSSVPTNPRIQSMWRFVEWYHVSDTAGRVKVAVDGVVVTDFSGTTGPIARGPTLCTIRGALLDDFYIGLPASSSDFFGDYVVSGLAPAATGAVPVLPNATVDQQYITYANVAPKQNATVDQQYIIVVIKNKAPTHVRPQVFGVGR